MSSAYSRYKNMLQKCDKQPLQPRYWISHSLLTRHDGFSGTSCILEMLCCHSDEEKHPRLVGQRPKRWRIVKLRRCRLDSSIIQSVIIFPGELTLFLILRGCFFASPCYLPLCLEGASVWSWEFVHSHCICCDTIWPGERLCTCPIWIPTFCSEVGLSALYFCVWTQTCSQCWRVF